MRITREKDKLVVRIPLKARRFNPYNEMAGLNPDTGEMDNIVGVIKTEEDGWKEMGFMYLQDMSYKGKDDQLTDWAVKWHGEPKDFEKLCTELKVSLWRI